MTTAAHHPRLRFAAAIGLLAALLLLLVPMLEAPADASTATTARVTARGMTPNQQRVVNDINASRRSRGKHNLTPNRLMNQRAQGWAQHLASCQCLEHRAGPYGAPGVGARPPRTSGGAATAASSVPCTSRSCAHRVTAPTS